MEGLLADVQLVLAFATTEYFKACATIHAPLRTASSETSRLYINEIADKCDKFIESTREELLKIALALKHARNQQARINRIPLELLVRIFQSDLDVHPIESSTLAQRRVSRIVSLSSVCSHWRKLAVETSSFWSYIPIHLSETLVALCVERANNRPLDILAIEAADQMAMDPNKVWQGENTLRGHIHNVRSLAVSAHTPGRACSPINWALESSIPWNLRELSVVHIREGRLSSFQPTASPLPDLTIIKLNTLAKGLHTLSLEGTYINWNNCVYERLCVLKLNNLNILLDELEQVPVASPVLQVLELIDVRLLGRRTKSGPLALPNLRTLRLSFPGSIYDSILDMFEPGAYNIELYINMSGMMQQPETWQRSYMPRILSIIRKMRNITVLGVYKHLSPLQEAYFPSIIAALPYPVTIRLEYVDLGREPILAVKNAVEAFPQIRQIQMRRANITDTETFKDLIENCSVERTELIDCWDTWDGTKSRIEPGTPLYAWVSKRFPKVSVLWE